VSIQKLGVACAVRDDCGRLLLSKHDDREVWYLPTEKPNNGELFTDTAIRAVMRTGIHAKITGVVGLYYYQGWQRMNILFEARCMGGDVPQHIIENGKDHFFALDDLPASYVCRQMVTDVLNDIVSPMRVITIPDDKQNQSERDFYQLWLTNVGSEEDTESTWVEHGIATIGLFYDLSKQKVITVPFSGKHDCPRPYVEKNSRHQPIWSLFRNSLNQNYDFDPKDFRLRGMIQFYRDTAHLPSIGCTVEFVFGTDINVNLPPAIPHDYDKEVTDLFWSNTNSEWFYDSKYVDFDLSRNSDDIWFAYSTLSYELESILGD